jgi:hypothetical protein
VSEPEWTGLTAPGILRAFAQSGATQKSECFSRLSRPTVLRTPFIELPAGSWEGFAIMNSPSIPAAASVRHTAPPLGIVATVYVVLKIASVFPVSAFGSKPPWFPGLSAPTEQVVSYFSTHAFPVMLCAFLQLGAAIPFGIFAATIFSRLRFLGVNAAGAYIAFFGGAQAAFSEFTSGAAISVMAQPLVAQNGPLVQAFHYLSVALGGPGFTCPSVC